MKKTLLTFALLIFFPLQLLAEMTPEAVVTEMFAKMKKAGSPAPMTEYIEWNEAYKNLPDMQKQQMGVKTPDELKAFMGRVLKDPSAVLKEKMEEQLAGQPPEQKEMMMRMMAGMNAQVADMQKKMSEDMKKTTMTIKSSEVKGDKATVNIQVSKDSKDGTKEEKDHTINLVKSDKRWLIPDMEFARKQQAGSRPPMGGGMPMGGAPMGG